MSTCNVTHCQIVDALAVRIATTRGSKKLIGLARTKTERKPLYIFGKGMMECARLNERRGLIRMIEVYEACVLTDLGFAIAQRIEGNRYGVGTGLGG